MRIQSTARFLTRLGISLKIDNLVNDLFSNCKKAFASLRVIDTIRSMLESASLSSVGIRGAPDCHSPFPCHRVNHRTLPQPCLSIHPGCSTLTATDITCRMGNKTSLPPVNVLDQTSLIHYLSIIWNAFQTRYEGHLKLTACHATSTPSEPRKAYRDNGDREAGSYHAERYFHITVCWASPDIKLTKPLEPIRDHDITKTTEIGYVGRVLNGCRFSLYLTMM